MQPPVPITHRFVEFIPRDLEPWVLYISIEFATCVHACASGCGNRVVTPLSPDDWRLTYDGETVSLSPSIGNWAFPCKSHYWIRNGEVVWAPRLSDSRIEALRSRQRGTRLRYWEGGSDT
jgi:Family of unknown function (DUF6527)